MTSQQPLKQSSKLEEVNNIVSEDYKFGFHTDAKTVVDTGKGLSRDVVAKISELKHEPEWMKEIRLKAYDEFVKQPLPSFGPDLTNLDYGDYTYFIRSSEGVSNKWDNVPEAIKDTFQKLGIPEQEKKYLAGVSTQFESEVVYHNTQVELQKQGVLFCDTDTALKEYPDIVKAYFGHLVPASDNKFAALNTAVWSGGSFIYVPKGVKLEKPLQSYFRINAERMGQFERTLIIVEDDADLNYVEGCTAPIWSKDSLHAAIVEIFIGKHAKCRYSTVQNWSNNIVNLVTKRAICDDYGRMEWIDGNVGSELNMKYPSCILKGKGSQGYTVSIAFAGKGQYQDTGSRMIHIGEGSSSTIISKSICRGGGVANYRGKVDIKPKAINCKSHVECDTLILDDISTSDTIPMNCVGNDSSRIEHEATVSKISDTELFYLMSRGISEADAMQMIVMGFIEPFARELPVEYAVELNQLIKLSMKEEKDPRLETKACGSV